MALSNLLRKMTLRYSVPQHRFFQLFLVAIATVSVSCSHSSDMHSGHSDSDPAAASASPHEGHGDHAAEDGTVHTNHDVFHSRTLEVPAGTPVPAVSVQVEEDPVRGWNLYVGTANFNFTPEDINGESSPTDGHGHLYINDAPAQRIYGTWTHLPELPPGETTVRVTLNANGHETLTTQGEPIQDSVTVSVYDPEAAE